MLSNIETEITELNGDINNKISIAVFYEELFTLLEVFFPLSVISFNSVSLVCVNAMACVGFPGLDYSMAPKEKTAMHGIITKNSKYMETPENRLQKK